MAGRHYSKLKDDVKKVLHRIPGIGDPMLEVARGLEEGIRQVFTPGSLFEELGFRYVGPVNGHSVPALLAALAEAKAIDGPVLLHAITQKGKGYKYAEDEPVEYHGPSPFDPVAGIQKSKSASAPSYTAVFGKAILRLAELDPRVVTITASMPDGTGLIPFAEKFPDRCLEHRHRRAALGDARRRSGARRPEAGGGDLLDFPAARLRPDLPRRLPDGPAGGLRARPRRHRRQRRLDPPRPVRLRLLPDVPEHHRDGPQGRERAPAHAGDRPRAGAPRGGALPARQRRRRAARRRVPAAAGGQGRGAAARPPRRGLGGRLDRPPDARGRRPAGQGGRRR